VRGYFKHLRLLYSVVDMIMMNLIFIEVYTRSWITNVID